MNSTCMICKKPCRSTESKRSSPYFKFYDMLCSNCGIMWRDYESISLPKSENTNSDNSGQYIGANNDNGGE